MNSVLLRIQRSGGGGAIQPSRDMSHTFKCQPLNLQGIDSLCFFTKGSLEKNMKNRSRVNFFFRMEMNEHELKTSAFSRNCRNGLFFVSFPLLFGVSSLY